MTRQALGPRYLKSLEMNGRLLQGRYRLERVLGRGGMGTVFLATDETTDCRVAVKELSVEGLGNTARAERVRQFRREADLLARLDHPQLPRVRGFFLENGQPYLVMDFVDGQNLEDLMRLRGLLSETVVRDWMSQLAGVLDYLHTQDPPVVFRDLKPSNILLGADERLVLVDFGIAKELPPAGGETRTGARGLLSPGFSAPEQYTGGTGPDSDLYGLGATAYALLSGQPPPCSLERLTGEANLPALQGVSPELTSLVERCLEPRRALRPGGAREVLQTLESLPPVGREPAAPVRLAPALAEPVTALSPLKTRKMPVPRKHWAVAALATLAALLFIFRPPAPLVAQVSSNPPGARVILADRVMGTTPCHLWLPPGGSHLTLMLAGYVPAPILLEGHSGSKCQLSVNLTPGEVDVEQALLSPKNFPAFYPFCRGPIPGRDTSNWESLEGAVSFRIPPGFHLVGRERSELTLAAPGTRATLRVEPDPPELDLMAGEMERARQEGWSVSAVCRSERGGWLRLERGEARCYTTVRSVISSLGQAHRLRLVVECAPCPDGDQLVRSYDLVRNNLNPRL